jgi:hypothetical protein
MCPKIVEVYQNQLPPRLDTSAPWAVQDERVEGKPIANRLHLLSMTQSMCKKKDRSRKGKHEGVCGGQVVHDASDVSDLQACN